MSFTLTPLKFSHDPDIKFNENCYIDIEYIVTEINYEGMMSGNINEVSINFIDMIKKKLIDKHTDCDYYIQGEYGDYLPSPFSMANYVDYMIPSILKNFIYSNHKKYVLNIRFYSNNKEFNYFDTKKYPTYTINISKLN
jgi:hypothetical protein